MNDACDCTSCQDVAQQLRDNPDMSMSQVIQEMSQTSLPAWERNALVMSEAITFDLSSLIDNEGENVSKHFSDLRKAFGLIGRKVAMNLLRINAARNYLKSGKVSGSPTLGDYLGRRESIIVDGSQKLKKLRGLSNMHMEICEKIIQKAKSGVGTGQNDYQMEEHLRSCLFALNVYSKKYFQVAKEMTLELNKLDVKYHWPRIPQSSDVYSANTSTKTENNGKVEVETKVFESKVREETLDILKNMLEAKKKEVEVTATASKEVATMGSDKFAISERLEGLSSVKDDAVRRIKQLSQIIDDMGGKEVTIHNVEKHAAECLDVEAYLSKFLTEVVPMEGMFEIMKEDRKVAKRTQKKWENRFEKAQKAVIEAKGAGRTRQAGEFRKLREIALQTSEQMRGNVKALEQNIEGTQSILHDVNMAKTKLLTVIVSCNRFIRDSAMTSKSAEKTTLVLASAFENINKLEENINKRGVRELTA